MIKPAESVEWNHHLANAIHIQTSLSEYYGQIYHGLTEKFDESLLMLSHKLGWEKVRYVKKLKNRAKPNLAAIPQHLLSKIEQLNYWDRKLYEYASKLFENNIEAVGPDFKDKITQFSQSNKKYIENNAAKGWDIGTGVA